MLDELRRALLDRESIREQLSKLKGLFSSGEIADDQYQRLREELQHRLQVAEQEVHRIKAVVSSKLAVIRPTMGAYEGQLNRLKQEAAGGKYTQQEYVRKVQKLAEDRAKFMRNERVAFLEAMLAAESPEALNGVVTSCEPEPEPPEKGETGRLGGIMLRGLLILTGSILIIGLFLPLLPVSIEPHFTEGQSLARIYYKGAGIAFHSERNGGASIAGLAGALLLPLLGGVLALALSFVKKQQLRGVLLLPLAVFLMGGFCAALALAMTYPLPALDELSVSLKEVSSWPPALWDFALGMAMLWFVILGHFLLSIRMLIVCGTLIFASAGGGAALGLLPASRAHAEIAVDLGNDPKQEETAEMFQFLLALSNKGNIPLLACMNENRRKASNRYQLSVFQRSGENGEWNEITGQCRSSAPEFPCSLVSPNDALEEGQNLTYALSAEKPKDLEKIWLQVRADNKTGFSVASQPLEITLRRMNEPVQPAPQESMAGNANKPAADTPENNATEEARKKVDELRLRLKSAKAGVLAESVREARSLVNQIQEENDRERFNASLDEAIINAKDRQAGELYQRALDAFQGESFARAASLAKQAIDVYDEEPKTVADNLSPAGDAIYVNAQTLIQNAAIANDPVRRYVVTGIFRKSGTEIAGFVQDTITQQTHRVSDGDSLNDCVVEKVTDGAIALKRGGEKYELHK